MLGDNYHQLSNHENVMFFDLWILQIPRRIIEKPLGISNLVAQLGSIKKEKRSQIWWIFGASSKVPNPPIFVTLNPKLFHFGPFYYMGMGQNPGT